MTTKGYFYSNIKSAKAAITLINKGEGIPLKRSITTTYCEASECIDGYYISHDEVTEKYLGLPIEIKLIPVKL